MTLPFFAQKIHVLKKILDKQFLAVLQLSTCRAKCVEFFGDKKVIRRSIHNALAGWATPTVVNSRFGMALGGAVCLNLEQRNYQPKPSGIDRTEMQD
jgi:hypothetical protein